MSENAAQENLEAVEEIDELEPEDVDGSKDEGDLPPEERPDDG